MSRTLLGLALVCLVSLPARVAQAATDNPGSDAVVRLPLMGSDVSGWLVAAVILLAALVGVLFATRKPTQ